MRAGRNSAPLRTLLTLSLVLMLGCGESSEPVVWQSGEGPPPTADEIIDRVRTAYASAQTYADSGMFELTYRLQGTPQAERHPASTVFDRQNASDLQWFSSRAHLDGQTQYVAIFDPNTRNLDGQTLTRTKVSFRTQLDWPEDPILRHFVSGSAELPLAKGVSAAWLRSLPIVLAAGGLDQPWFLGKREVQETSFLDGRECVKIRVATNLGRCVVWIDKQESLVRRIELPPGLLDEEMLRKSGVEEPRLVLDMADATWDIEPHQERLAWAPSEGMRKVRQFVSLPEPFPTETIGFRPKPFRFATIQGTPVEATRWEGKRTAFLWFSSEAVCRGPVTEFLKSAAQVTGDVEFAAICTDPSTSFNAAALTELTKRWGIDATKVLRDPEQAGKTEFDVTLLPTVVVLGADGRVQFYKVISDGIVGDELQVVLRRLEEGQDIAAEMRAEYRDYLKVYQMQVAEASFGDATTATTRTASFAPQKLPEQFRTRPLRQAMGIASPGNLTSVMTSQGERLAALDGYQSLRILTADGNIEQTIDLGREAIDVYTQIRSSVVKDQVTWALGSVLGTRIRLISPTAETPTPTPQDPQSRAIDVVSESPVRDWLVGNAASSEQTDLWIGHWQQLGLRRINASGEPQNQSNFANEIASLAWETNPDGQRSLLATRREGGLFRVSADLANAESIPISAWTIAHIHTSPESDPAQATRLALALDSRGTVHAVGFDSKWQERFAVPLSHEVFGEQVQFVQPGKVGERLVWAVARPDGTIHLISGDGKLRDRFQVGAEIRGLTWSSSGDGTLWISSPGKLEAWQVETSDSVASDASPNSLR